jgi:hemolysin III
MTRAPATKALREQTAPEEIVNAVTHGVGAAVAAVALAVLAVLAVRRGDPRHVLAAVVYGASLVLLFSASALYHGVRAPRAKAALHLLDHAAIYLLIAGTYTPFTLIALRGAWGGTLLAAIWALAALGVGMTLFPLTRFRRAPVLVYVGMGWLIAFAPGPLLRGVGTSGALWLLAGGLLYTGGVLFYRWRKLPYNHAIWHLFVLAGAACHFVAALGLMARPAGT